MCIVADHVFMALYDHSEQKDDETCHKAQTGVLNMRINSLFSDGIHNRAALIWAFCKQKGGGSNLAAASCS